MKVKIELKPEVEEHLRAEAARQGITAEEYALRLIRQALDEMERTGPPVEEPKPEGDRPPEA